MVGSLSTRTLKLSVEPDADLYPGVPAQPARLNTPVTATRPATAIWPSTAGRATPWLNTTSSSHTAHPTHRRAPRTWAQFSRTGERTRSLRARGIMLTQSKEPRHLRGTGAWGRQSGL